MKIEKQDENFVITCSVNELKILELAINTLGLTCAEEYKNQNIMTESNIKTYSLLRHYKKIIEKALYAIT